MGTSFCRYLISLSLEDREFLIVVLVPLGRLLSVISGSLFGGFFTYF